MLQSGHPASSHSIRIRFTTVDSWKLLLLEKVTSISDMSAVKVLYFYLFSGSPYSSRWHKQGNLCKPLYNQSFITSTKEGMWQPVFVWLFAIQVKKLQTDFNYTVFSGNVDNGQRKTWWNFGDVLDSRDTLTLYLAQNKTKRLWSWSKTAYFYWYHLYVYLLFTIYIFILLP